MDDENCERVEAAEQEGIISDFKDRVVDEVTRNLTEKIRDATNGAVKIDSILQGQIKVDGNGYIDKVLTKLTDKLKNSSLHNVGLPDHTLNFEKSFLCGLMIPGQVEFLNGFINGLSTLCRMGDAELIINVFQDPIITAKAVIGVTEAVIGSNANVLLAMCLSANDVQIGGGLKDVSLTIRVRVNRDFSAHLDEFDVKHTGSLSVGFENLGSYDFLADTIKGDLDNTIKEAVVEYLQTTAKNVTDEIVSSLPFQV